MKSFASDNYSGVHPQVINALVEANSNHQISYGDDELSKYVNSLFKNEFGDVEILYTFNGTGANMVSLRCCLLPFQSVICAETAHIVMDECGGPTQITGSTMQTLKTSDGKLTPELIETLLSRKGDVHHVQPKLISISQCTELGTVYSLDELKAIADFAHANDMYLHVDGARIANAVAYLGCSLKEATVDCGVDIMSFGGTKNGIMFGEAILIFNKELRNNAPFFHKQTAQLFSKNRFIAAQFKAVFEKELWRELALHSNKMAKRLYKAICHFEDVKVVQKVQSNAVFVIIPKQIVESMREQFPFYDWDTRTGVLRWMCSFDTTEDEVDQFVELLKKSLETL